MELRDRLSELLVQEDFEAVLVTPKLHTCWGPTCILPPSMHEFLNVMMKI